MPYADPRTGLIKTLYITPGSSSENGYCEPFNGSMRDELLNGESSTPWPKLAS